MDAAYSLNAPVPESVRHLCERLQEELPDALPRRDPTLVCKRLTTERTHTDFPKLRGTVESAIEGTPAMGAEIDGIELFEDPPSGSAPVVYLAVRSPGLEALHADLCSVFQPAPEMEGDAYVPHVTVARGGTADAARRLTERQVDAIRWTIPELQLYDARHGEVVSRYRLPFP